jgi:Protein of unknown function (DUF2281)
VPCRTHSIGRPPSRGKAPEVRLTFSLATRAEPDEPMEDVLRQRLIRKIESLPEEQVYQVLDYIEFLDTKYGGTPEEASGLQKFAEGIQDKMRRKAMNPSTLREAFQILSTADKVLSSVSNAGKQLMEEFTGSGEGTDGEGDHQGDGAAEGEPDTASTGGTDSDSEGPSGPQAGAVDGEHAQG